MVEQLHPNHATNHAGLQRQNLPLLKGAAHTSTKIESNCNNMAEYSTLRVNAFSLADISSTLENAFKVNSYYPTSIIYPSTNHELFQAQSRQ